MDLRELGEAGPYRLIVDGATERHVEYFTDPAAALDRWAEFDAAMRPDFDAASDVPPSIH